MMNYENARTKDEGDREKRNLSREMTTERGMEQELKDSQALNFWGEGSKREDLFYGFLFGVLA